MSAINSFHGIGRIANKDQIVLRESSNGSAYVFFSLAINEQDRATFINCSAWNKTATLISEHCKKGTLIGIEGSVSVYNKKREDGSYENNFSIVVHSINFLESKQQQEAYQEEEYNNYEEETKPEKNPYDGQEVNIEEIKF